MQRKKRIAGAIAGIGFCILLGSGIALWEHFQGMRKNSRRKHRCRMRWQRLRISMHVTMCWI
ncbi:MAG: hypothetical protein ACLS20_07605 [Faecalimonas umbilicata]